MRKTFHSLFFGLIYSSAQRRSGLGGLQSHPAAANPTVPAVSLHITADPETFSESEPLSLCLCSLFVSLSSEVMWGTSCGPYLSCPVVLILPWLSQQPRRTGRQAGSQGWRRATPRGTEPGHWGSWET